MSDNNISLIKPPANVVSKSYFSSYEKYMELYKKSITSPDDFWKEQAEKHLTWIQPFTSVSSGSFEAGNISWFKDGKLNISVQCIKKGPSSKAPFKKSSRFHAVF